MTIVDIDTKPRRVTTKNTSVVEGRIDRCGFDGGGESGAAYVLTFEGSPQVHMLFPRSMQIGRSRHYLENTMALTRQGDQVSITFSKKGEAIGFDNISAGRTMATMREEVPEKSGDLPIVLGIVGIFVFLILAITVALAIANASIIYKVENSNEAPRPVADLLPRGDESGYLGRMPEGWPGIEGQPWRIVDGRGGSMALTRIDTDEAADICAEVARQDHGTEQLACTDSEGFAASAENATDFAYRM